MASAQIERLANGKWRVFRDFDSLPAATAAIGKLAEINEAAFQPHKPIIASVPRVPHGVAQAAIRDGVMQVGEPARYADSFDSHHAIEAPMPPFQEEEPPLRACPTGGCGED